LHPRKLAATNYEHPQSTSSRTYAIRCCGPKIKKNRNIFTKSYKEKLKAAAAAAEAGRTT